MTQESDLSNITLAGLAQQCAAESDRFFRREAHDPRYCFELFRRAIVEKNELAWKLLVVQYTPLVTSWVCRHSAFQASGEGVETFVNGAFYRFLKATPPDKFSKFENLKSVLKYLQGCVAGDVVDHVRAMKTTLPLDAITTEAKKNSFADPVEEIVGQRNVREQVWEVVLAVANDEDEYLLIYHSYVLGMKPAEICTMLPERFPDVKRVYRLKENVLARLRRNDTLQTIFESST